MLPNSVSYLYTVVLIGFHLTQRVATTVSNLVSCAGALLCWASQCTRASVLDECAGRVSHRMVDPPCQLSESAIKIE